MKKFFSKVVCFAVCIAMVMPMFGATTYAAGEEETQITASSSFTTTPMISAGGTHTAALKSDGTVWAWGSNSRGQLGDGTTTPRHTPVQVRGEGAIGFLNNIIEISAGDYHTVALRNDPIGYKGYEPRSL